MGLLVYLAFTLFASLMARVSTILLKLKILAKNKKIEVFPMWVVCIGIKVLVESAYYLNMYKRVVFGENSDLANRKNCCKKLSPKEIVLLISRKNIPFFISY